MKTVNKIILCSCVFCYFAGIWMLASRFGVIKALNRYGVSEFFSQIPKDFPNMKYLYIGLAVYTVLFAVITYFIYKVITKQGAEQDKLQQDASEVSGFSEKLNSLYTNYIRLAKEKQIKDKTAELKLKQLYRIVSSFPPAVIRDAAMKATLSNIIINLNEQLSPELNSTSFVSAIDSAIDTVNSLKRKCVNVK